LQGAGAAVITECLLLPTARDAARIPRETGPEIDSETGLPIREKLLDKLQIVTDFSQRLPKIAKHSGGFGGDGGVILANSL
jgi:hypothetical protein